MSRLDSAIRRLEAQRACIGRAAQMLGGLPGYVFEFGLGNGRTYDHLREQMPGREIFVFEREVAAHPDCIPSGEHLVLGDLRQTVPGLPARFRDQVVFLHSDIGSGDPARSRQLAAELAPHVAPLMRAGGLIASDLPFPGERWTAEPLPPGIAAGRYHFYRVL